MTATSKSSPRQLLIGDRWLPVKSERGYTSDNPHNGEGGATVPDAGAAGVATAVSGFVERAVHAGATLASGGAQQPEAVPLSHQATILTDVLAEAEVARRSWRSDGSPPSRQPATWPTARKTARVLVSGRVICPAVTAWRIGFAPAPSGSTPTGSSPPRRSGSSSPASRETPFWMG